VTKEVEIIPPGGDPTLEALNRAAAEMTPQDIDLIIAYQRKQRGAWERGERPKKGDGGNSPALSKLLNLPSPVKMTGEFKRRV